MFGAAMCLGDFVWLGGLGPFSPLQRHSILPVLHFLYILPPFPSFFFFGGAFLNYSYVPLIPCRLKLISNLRPLSEFFFDSRYLSGTLASQRLSLTILSLDGIRLRLDG